VLSFDILGALVKNTLSPSGIRLLDMKFKFLRCLIWIILFIFIYIYHFYLYLWRACCHYNLLPRILVKKEDARESNSLVSSAWRKYLTNFVLRFSRNHADGIQHRDAYFLHAASRGLADIKEHCCKHYNTVTISPSSSCSFHFSVFVAENCNFPRREGMRLSVDGFLNANNLGNRNH